MTTPKTRKLITCRNCHRENVVHNGRGLCGRCYRLSRLAGHPDVIPDHAITSPSAPPPVVGLISEPTVEPVTITPPRDRDHEINFFRYVYLLELGRTSDQIADELKLPITTIDQFTDELAVMESDDVNRDEQANHRAPT